jgi:Fe-S cluster biogenesis protein NfuA
VLIVTEPTPNPDALKFIPETPLTAGATYAFARQAFDPAASALARRLFEIADVARVFVAPEFVTVTRAPRAAPWSSLRYEVMAAVAEQLASGEAAVAEPSPEPSDPVHDQIEAEIRQVLADYVKPGVSRDGGEVLFERFDHAEGVLWIRMQGACGGCPSSRLTLKAGVETLVRRYVPEVIRVEEAAGEAAAPAGPSALRRWIANFGGAGAGGKPRTVFSHAGRQVSR